MSRLYFYFLSFMTTAWAVAVRRKRNAKNLLQRSSRYAAQESRESSAGGASPSSPNVGSLLEKVRCVGEGTKREVASGTATPVNASAEEPEASGAEAATSGNSSGNESNTTTATTTGHPRPEYDTALDAGPTQAAPGGKLAPLGFTFPDYSGAKKLPKGDATMYVPVDQGLIGKVFTFEINMDGAMSNMAATYYLTREEPDDKLAGDANCKNPTGRCAAEMDFMEANNCGFRVAPHICQHDQTQPNAVVSTVGNHYPKPVSGVKGDIGGPCDIGGCILAVFQMMAKDWVEKGARAPDAAKPWLWGPGQYINSKQWHEVAYYFQKGPSGDLVGLWLRLKQGKRAATLPVCHPATATQYTPVIGAQGQYLKLMGNHLKAGKIWRINHSYWSWWKPGDWNWLTAAPGTNPQGAAADSNPNCDKVGQGYPAFFNGGLNETFRNVRMHDVA